jgi:hypothetical protein
LAPQEVAYHTFLHGVGELLTHDNKDLRPLLQFHIGAYGFKYVKEVVVEVEILTTIFFGEERFKRNDPLYVSSKH